MKTSFLSAVAALALTTAIPTVVFGQVSAAVDGHSGSVPHTHIGINPTWQPTDWGRPTEGAVDTDPTDDNKLWLFSMPPNHEAATPGWPAWQHADGSTFLVLTAVLQEGEHIAKPGDPNKALYACNFLYGRDEGYGDPHGAEHLDGWSSAFGPQGAWNLASADANSVPTWDIYLRRERISGNLMENDFFLLLPDDTAALQADGDLYSLPKRWLADEHAWEIGRAHV